MYVFIKKHDYIPAERRTPGFEVKTSAETKEFLFVTFQTVSGFSLKSSEIRTAMENWCLFYYQVNIFLGIHISLIFNAQSDTH